ncbi:MAG: HesA/MoeB/ThiF family protein [Xanthomonadales bacterium]|nr:HesA/MoeB/ThiF family protein [Xanthomonadales bacterium]
MNTESNMARYSAHLSLAEIGRHGQQHIRDSHIALIGAGGLGCAAAQYLVSSGLGTLTLCDFDTVAESNLARQILYRAADVGRLKVEAAAASLRALNPDSTLHTVAKRMADEDMQNLFPACDLVIDASDNYGTRLAVNRNCLALKKPWIMASCIRMEGQIMYLRPDLPEQPCYRCAYGSAPDTLEDCPGAGIFAPVAGIVGAAAAHFALSGLAGKPPPAGIHLFDAANWQWQSLKIGKQTGCRDCA